MKKLFTLLTLLVAIVTGASAANITATWFSGNNSTTATVSPENTNVTTTAAAGTGYSIGGTRTEVKLGEGTVTAVNVPIPKNTTVAADAYAELVSFSISPNVTYTFAPTSVSFYACTQSFGDKTGDNNAVLAYEVFNGSKVVKAKTDVSIGRNDSGTGLTQISANLSKVTCVAGDDIVLKVYLRNYSQTSAKNIVLYDVAIAGSVDEAGAQTKYSKPDIAVGDYNVSTGLYPVTLSVQNEEVGSISYKIGEGEFVHDIASGTVINVAPSTQITAYVSGTSFDQSDNETANTPAMPKLATPTISVGAYNFDKNTYPITVTTTDGGASLFYTLDGGEALAYSAAIDVAPGVVVQAYATQTNMTQSDNANKTVAAAPCGGTESTPQTDGAFVNNTDYVMSAITIPGACIAGQISSGTTPINRSIKTRCNQGLTEGVGFYVNVNANCKVTAITIEGCSNQTGANTCTGVYVDGVAIDFTSVELPLAASNVDAKKIEVSGINATKKIEFVFENNYQAQMIITVTSEVVGSLALSDNDNFNYGFGSFCAPHNFTVAEGAAAYKATLDGDAITLSKIEGVVPANTGVIIVGDKGANATIGYTNKNATEVSDNDLKGTTVRTLTSTLKGNYDKFLTLQKSTSKFIEYAGEYFPANRAYIATNTTLTSKEMSFDIKFADATSVKNVEAITSANGPKAIKKAIVNGRLVILTEKGYVNALGQTVK